MRKLKLAPNYLGIYENDERADNIFKDQGTNGFRQNDWWYLHGKLEYDCSYDKAVIINWRDIPTKETYDWVSIRNSVAELYSDDVLRSNYLEGEYDVEVDGIDYPCKGIFWITDERTVHSNKGDFQVWNQRGLVVACDDIEALEYARLKYKERTTHI